MNEQCGLNAACGTFPMMLVSLVIVVFMIVVMWRIYTKADKQGWGCLIPFYNVWLMLEIAGKPGWWLVFCFIPVINVVVQIVMLIGVAKNFGRGGWFAAGLIFLPIIFFPILAFGDSVYGASDTPAAAGPQPGSAG